MIPWAQINRFVFQAGQKRSPQELVHFILYHLNSLVSFDGGVLFYLNRSGDCLASETVGEQRDLYPYLHFYQQKYSLKQVSAHYYQNYPQVNECVLNSSQVNDPAIRAYWKHLGIKQSFGVGLWDSDGYLRCLISLDRLTNQPFTDREKQIIEIIFHHLNNLFQNLLTTSSITVSSSPKLTKREQQIGQLILQGADRQAIADRLHISPATVAKHIANMHHALGVQSQQELMLKLFRIL